MKTLGWLLQCEDRNLFVRDRAEIEWAFSDENYTVTELIDKKESQSNLLLECEEARQLLTDLYALQEEEIGMLRERIKELEK